MSGGHVYWAAAGAGPGFGAIWEANPDGSSAHAIVTRQDGPNGVAADASHLYWASGGSSAIYEANLDGSGAHAIVTGQPSAFGVAVSPP